MAQRQTERDTYGGERRWQEGAGESWTGTERGKKPAEGGKETDPESARVIRNEDDKAAEGGVLHQIAEELGITHPDKKK